MSRFIPPFISPTPIQPSNFYTSDTKDTVFNFTGNRTIPVTVEQSCYYTPPPPSFTHREKRKSESSVPGSDEDVPPNKVYLSETAMSNHFAELRLSTQEGAFSTATQSSKQAFTATDFDDVDPVVDDDTGQVTEESNETSAIELSQCLRDHLKEYPPDYPREKLLRKILQPKPVLDLVLYDPAIVPPSFRSEPEEEEQENESKVNPPSTKPTVPAMDTMEIEGYPTLLQSSAPLGFQPMEL